MLVFLDVVDARSFTLAADRLGRTKSAVSQTISRLEDDLGCKLLFRSTRALSLTEAGTRFYARCHELKQAYETALADIRDVETGGEGLLTVTAPHALSAPLVLPAITDFMHQFPGLQVRLLSIDTAMNLAEAQIDLAIRVGQPTQQGARVSRLGDMPEGLYASPCYMEKMPLFSGEITDLAEWDHIANDWQGNPVAYDAPNGQKLRIRPKVRCSSLPDVCNLAKAGAGVALLPDIMAQNAVEEGALLKVVSMGASPIFSLHEFGRYPPPKVKAFIRLLRTRLKASVD